jgi:hemolysin III
MKQRLRIEEICSSSLHGIGVGLSIVGFILLMILSVKGGDIKRVISFGIYGVSLFLLYLASTLYHGIRSVKAKHILRVCDHASIYLLIAGTYTPFCLVTMPYFWGYLLLAILWPLAIVGILFKVFYVGRYKVFSTLVYVVMGWVALIAIKPFFESLSDNGCLLVVLGGLLYTIGVIFYACEKIPFNHVIWHMFVLSGSACHFFAVLLYVVPLTSGQ